MPSPLFVKRILFLVLIFLPWEAGGQNLLDLRLGVSDGISVEECLLPDSQVVRLQPGIPLFSLDINDTRFSSTVCETVAGDDNIEFSLGDRITGVVTTETDFEKGWKAVIELRNRSYDTLRISNVVPFGASPDKIHITGEGPWALARAKLFLPGRGPVDVILPDNAWEMGYASVPLNTKISLCAIARRSGYTDAERRRYETVLPPRGTVQYTMYADNFYDEWQNGLKLMFRDRFLFDLDEFDNTLYEREDLKWIRDKYTMILQAGWDHDFYDHKEGNYTFYHTLEEGKKYLGKWDVYCLWPTWPRLGVDQRNQWDMYRDLPLGLEKLQELANYSRIQSTAFFISYNPWDQSTREEDHYKGMANLIETIGADGVVLDTRGKSSYELQHAADSVREGVIMYSEGMAIPVDMPGIVSGRVHNAIVMSPPLNLNKLIKPDFAIFRVVQRNDDRIHREVAISFFNGYGTEINAFAPGRPAWLEEEYGFLGRTTMILRENSTLFLNNRWTPLIYSIKDSIWVNEWQDDNKTLYTVLSLDPKGYQGKLFKAKPSPDHHYVSLWNHEELELQTEGQDYWVPVNIRSFNKEWQNTRMEGNLECIAKLPRILDVRLDRNVLKIASGKGDKITVWKGMPSYQGISQTYEDDSVQVNIQELFGRYEGKIVIQLFEDKHLLDERVINMEVGKPIMISEVIPTKRVRRPFANMEEIPAGEFHFSVSNDDQFIPYPDYANPEKIKMDRFFMDRYPVTNAEFYQFMVSSNYQPADPTNFLKHWENGTYPQGQDNYPVVYVSLEDAQAYAKWAGKRLPTEMEWQYAAQGTDGRQWPWGDEFHGTKCNNAFERPTPVDAFPKGVSPFNISDMVGNIWQMTNDVYDNGSYYFNIIRGGSYYKPTSSWWYVKGGPQPLNKTQMLLLVSPGFDRNATVGFRCVMDADNSE